MFQKAISFFLFSGAIITGCDAVQVKEVKTESKSSTENRQQNPSKKDGGRKCLRLVNGQDTESYKASVLLGRKIGAGLYVCSGTWIGTNMLITAGHCVNPSNPKDLGFISSEKVSTASELTVAFNAAKFPVSVVHHGPGFIGTGMNLADYNVFSKDIAILVFSDDLSSDVIETGTSRPAKGTTVRMLGWGSKVADTVSNDPVRVRQTGTNVTLDTASFGFDGLATPRSGTFTAPGDSGGSLLMNDKLVGVTSGFFTSTGGTIHTFADLSLPVNKALIDQAVSVGGKLGTPVIPPPETPPSPTPGSSEPTTDDSGSDSNESNEDDDAPGVGSDETESTSDDDISDEDEC